MRFSLILSLAGVIFLTVSGIAHVNASNPVMALNGRTEDPTPTPTPDPEIEALNRETQIAQAKKAKAEAEKAAVEAKLAADKARLGIGNSPSASAPSGDISGDKDKFIEAQLLAEFSARKASQLVFTKVCSSQNPTFKTNPIKVLVVNSSSEKSSVVTYTAILAQLQFLHMRYEQLNDQAESARGVEELAPALLIPAATEAVKSAADLINMFRTSNEFKDQTVNVDVRMVVTLLTNDLLKETSGICDVKEIYYPSVYTMGISSDASTGPMMTAYHNLLDDVSRGNQEVAANNELIAKLRKAEGDTDKEIEKLQKAIKEHETPAPKATGKAKNKKNPPEEPFDLEKAKNDLSRAIVKKENINSRIEQLKQTAASIESFKNSLADLLKLLTAVDSATNTPALVGLLRAERLHKLLALSTTYSLEMQVTAAGTNKISKNAFFSAKVSHSGGVSIGVNLFNSQDQLVLGQREQYYIDFTNSKEIRRLTGFQKLDPSFAQGTPTQNNQQSSHH